MNNNTRQSNIELLRIIAMFLVVAHHYVVNSGISTGHSLSVLSGQCEMCSNPKGARLMVLLLVSWTVFFN